MKNGEAPTTPVDARYAATVIAQLTYDLGRAVSSGVPAALHDAAADLGSERLAILGRRVIEEIGVRFRVSATATLMTIDP